jgi:hypothetical protein
MKNEELKPDSTGEASFCLLPSAFCLCSGALVGQFIGDYFCGAGGGALV